MTRRKRLGVYYTPKNIASGLSQIALRGIGSSAHVGDPTCGDGALLVNVADVLVQQGASVERVATEQLFGADIDPHAIAQTRARISDWALRTSGRDIPVPESHFVVADSLLRRDDQHWLSSDGALDAIVGNPPFGAQLKAITATDAQRRDQLAKQLGIGALGYADTAALFLMRSVQLVRRGGIVALILPDSIMAARDARATRQWVTDRTEWEAVWIGDEPVGFDASVNVWAPVLRVKKGRELAHPILRYSGADFVPRSTIRMDVATETWAPIAADLLGGFDASAVRSIVATDHTLGDVAEISAGFRRHFYGLAPHVTEQSEGHDDALRLVTTGSIDPMHFRRNDAVRFAGSHYSRPTINVESLRSTNASLFTWVEKMNQPKVLVASQGKVVEAIADEAGNLVPSTPVVAVVSTPGSRVSLAHILALVSSPVAAALLHQQQSGTGLSSGVCRVSASFLAGIPLPRQTAYWDAASRDAAQAQHAAFRGDAHSWSDLIDELGQNMLWAFGVEDQQSLFAWWKKQVPPFRSARR